MKYQVKFSEPVKPESINEMSFEVAGKVYHEGDAFEPPANWKVNMDGFIGHGVRFVEPYEVWDEETSKMVNKGDWRNVILPVVPIEEPKKERTPKGG